MKPQNLAVRARRYAGHADVKLGLGSTAPTRDLGSGAAMLRDRDPRAVVCVRGCAVPLGDQHRGAHLHDLLFPQGHLQRVPASGKHPPRTPHTCRRAWCGTEHVIDPGTARAAGHWGQPAPWLMLAPHPLVASVMADIGEDDCQHPRHAKTQKVTRSLAPQNKRLLTPLLTLVPPALARQQCF